MGTYGVGTVLQIEYIHQSKITIPHQWVYVDTGGDYPCTGAGACGKISIHSAQCCCESKSALKSKTYFKKVKNKKKNTTVTSYSVENDWKLSI